MSYPKLKIGGREIIALVPADAQQNADGQGSKAAPPELQQLVEIAREKRDAVAFGFVQGQWHPAA